MGRRTGTATEIFKSTGKWHMLVCWQGLSSPSRKPSEVFFITLFPSQTVSEAFSVFVICTHILCPWSRCPDSGWEKAKASSWKPVLQGNCKRLNKFQWIFEQVKSETTPMPPCNQFQHLWLGLWNMQCWIIHSGPRRKLRQLIWPYYEVLFQGSRGRLNCCYSVN